MELNDENYKKVDREIVHPMWNTIRTELNEKKFISREDISKMMDEARAAAKELIGPDVFANPYLRWSIPITNAKLVTVPGLGLACVENGEFGDSMVALYYPSGDIKRYMLCKGFV